ncbi:MAG: ribonuclease HII, partial [Candidatus Azotimanducaceae bacterium]
MYWRECCAGVDEVGRGPLAGAVYAAAVILDPFAPMSGLRDSKALSEARRDALDVVIRTHALAYCVASASIKEIDEINILQASLLAMQRAVAGLNHPVDFVMVDGNRTPG